jgi:hypothetical protein
MARCECIKCGKAMKNFQPPEEGLQPIGGLAFQTRGHYGSAYFDGGMGYLEIAFATCVWKRRSRAAWCSARNTSPEPKTKARFLVGLSAFLPHP